jgi:hypothetical protein
MKRHRGDFLHEMTSKAGPRRFKYDHAKYAVIDGDSLLIGSENYSPTGTPVPGTQGNRGWEVWIQDPALNKIFGTMFQDDSNLKYGDMLDLTGGDSAAAAELDTTRKPRPTPPGGGNESPGQSLSLNRVEAFRSPDTSLNGLVTLIQSAKSTLDIEQMTFESVWDNGSRSSPVFDAVVAAAKRGVKVRVLLNDESVFGGGDGDNPATDTISASKPKNVPTVQAFTKLRIPARIANLKAMGVKIIHNKGVVIDGHLTLISSINWGENSITHNRETAVVLDSADAFNFYENLFNEDWQNSGGNLSTHELPPNGPMNQPTEVSVTDCPAQLSLSVQVGQLSLQMPRDASFENLSGATFQGVFTRENSSRQEIGCILTNSGREYVQIRERSDGEKMISMEGYTSGSKLYIIRTILDPSDDPSSDLDGTFDAKVINGSGARNPILGTAVMKVQTQP